jgi:hypothetical protein
LGAQTQRSLVHFWIGDMPTQHPEEIIMEGSKEQYVHEPRQSSPAGLIIRQKEPINLEMPFDQVDSYLTPTELFYIRSHSRRQGLTSRIISSGSMARSGTRWR